MPTISQNSVNVDMPSTIGKGYGAFWKFKGRYRVVKGSRASKKSKTTALNIIYRMMEMPLANTLVVRKTFNTLRDSCWSDLQWAVHRLKVDDQWTFTASPLSAMYKPTKQQIFFRGLDDPQKLASISCITGFICWCWIEEAYEIEKEEDFDMVDDTIRGEMPEGYFKQLTLTFNPWSDSTWIKKRFFDRQDPDIFAATTTFRCNEWLDAADLKRFEDMRVNNPQRFKVAGDGDWGLEGGAVFEEWANVPEHYKDRLYTHVIEPFEIPESWRIYRGFDFGYAKPFSIGWWAADYDGRLYRILELYGCTSEPNTGVKWPPDQIFAEVKRIENEHRWLKGKHIYGVADPSIWDESRGISIAEMGERQGVYFEPGDNHRIPGWMQMHYRLRFDEQGIPMMYVFNTCKGFIRTIPVLKYDDVKPEDIDTDLEDHIADECLVGDTMIQTDKGPAMIQDLVGTSGLVLASDGKYHKYHDARLTRKNAEVFTLITDTGRTITATANHPFKMKDGTYKMLKDIRDGDELWSEMRVARIIPAGVADVFNMEVDDIHDYMANGIAVHNCRYVCMARPMTPPLPEEKKQPQYDPLSTDDYTIYDQYSFYIKH